MVINISRNYNVASTSLERGRSSPQTMDSAATTGRYHGSSLIPKEPPRTAAEKEQTMLGERDHHRSSQTAIGQKRKSVRRSPSPGEIRNSYKKKKAAYRKHSEPFREEHSPIMHDSRGMRRSKQSPGLSVSTDLGHFSLPFSPQARVTPMDAGNYARKWNPSLPTSPEAARKGLPPIMSGRVGKRKSSTGSGSRVATATGNRSNTLKMMYSHI